MQTGRFIHDDLHSMLRRAATRVRIALTNVDLTIVTRRFPHGCCKVASQLLAKYLSERVAIPKRLITFSVNGTRRLENGTWIGCSRLDAECISHAWLEVDGIIVDITADQFGNHQPVVIVTTDRTWHQSFQGQEIKSYWELMNFTTNFNFKAEFDQDYSIMKTDIEGDYRLSRFLLDRINKLVPLFDQGGVIYMITCISPGADYGKRYVGLTTRPIEYRQFEHEYAAYVELRSHEPLYKAMRKYSPQSDPFKCEIIDKASSWIELRNLEKAAILAHRTHVSTGEGFNLSWGGEGMSPQRRLETLVSNEWARQRPRLESGNTHARKLFARRFNIAWNRLCPFDQLRHLEHDAIRAAFVAFFKEQNNLSLLKIGVRTNDPAVVEAIDEYLLGRSISVDSELNGLLCEVQRTVV